MAETFITSGDPLLVVQQETDVCPHNLTGPIWDGKWWNQAVQPSLREGLCTQFHLADGAPSDEGAGLGRDCLERFP